MGQASNQGDPNTISALVQKAKSSHIDHVSLVLPQLHYADPKTPELAVDSSSVVVAQLIAEVTTHTELDLITWYKFRLLEALHRQPRSFSEKLPSDIPSVLLPIDRGEFLTSTFSGSEVIGGVTVSETDPLVSKLEMSRTYILFGTFRSEGVASLLYGHSGVFLLDTGGRLKPMREMSSNKLASALHDRHVDEVGGFRSFAGTRR
jgi:hypothetical protein